MAKIKSNPFVIYVLWIIATMIGWLAGIFSLDSNAETYMDVIRLLPIYFADGLLIGLAVGIGQAFVLKRFIGLISAWVWATALGYGLAFLMGLIVSVLIPSIVWMFQGAYLLPIIEPSTTTIFLNMDDLFWGGILIGAMQWPILRKFIPSPNRNKAILWTLATWFVLGVSVFVRALTYRNFLAEFQMGIMGIVMGIATGLVLLVFLSSSETVRKYYG